MRSPSVVDASTPGLSRGHRALLVLAVAVCRILSIRACPVYDDAFITYRYARNFAADAGLIFNPGQPWEPVLGTTTPAYALLLSLFSRVGVDLITASLSINILCDVACAWLMLKLLEARRTAAIVSVLAFAALPQLARICVGGMEAPLFALLALCSARSLERERSMRAGVFGALACTVRPEGVLLIGVLCLERLRRPRQLLALLVPVALIGLASVGLLEAFYGTPIPQSVAAKSQMHGPDTIKGVLLLWKSILAQAFSPHPAYLVCLPWVLVGLRQALLRPSALRTFSGFALAITASYLAARPHIWGWYFYVPLVAWTAWLGLGIAQTQSWLGARARAPHQLLLRLLDPRLATALVVLAVGAVSFALPTHVPERVYQPLQHWARRTSDLHPKARILASDIGAIGYAWRGTVLDSEGLTWPQALRYPFPNAMIQAISPEYLLIVAEKARLGHFMERPDLMQQYQPIARFSILGRTELEPDLEELDEWRQDYLVYQRKDL